MTFFLHSTEKYKNNFICIYFFKSIAIFASDEKSWKSCTYIYSLKCRFLSQMLKHKRSKNNFVTSASFWFPIQARKKVIIFFRFFHFHPFLVHFGSKPTKSFSWKLTTKGFLYDNWLLSYWVIEYLFNGHVILNSVKSGHC